MLAARDQENLVHGHQQAAASKPLNQSTRGLPPKTPGNKYPKTPLKINLNDENETVGLGGGRTALGTKGKGLENLVTGGKNGATTDKNAFITPMGPRNRAPLGLKTTNAKTKAFQTPAGPVLDKDPFKTQTRVTSGRRPKPRISHGEPIKLNIHGDENVLLEDKEPEYCPPNPKPLPYESDVFPDGCLDYEVLKSPNLMRGWHNYYLNPLDENGVSLKEKRLDAEYVRYQEEADAKLLKEIEETEWTVGDVPETFTKLHIKDENDQKSCMASKIANQKVVPSRNGPSTITSRKAAFALSVAPKVPDAITKKPKTTTTSQSGASFLLRGKKGVAHVPINQADMRHAAAAVASRSTMGYTKGRNASTVLKMRGEGLPRLASNLSDNSDTIVKTSSYAIKQGSEAGNDNWERLMLFGLFDDDEKYLEPCLRGVSPDCLRKDDDGETEFVMTLSGN